MYKDDYIQVETKANGQAYFFSFMFLYILYRLIFLGFVLRDRESKPHNKIYSNIKEFHLFFP